MGESFSSKLKKELCTISPEKACCRKAQVYGLLQFGRNFSADMISLHTENAEVAACYLQTVRDVTGITPILHTGEQVQECRIPGERERGKVLNCFGHSEKELNRRINRANIENECCAGAFLRGVFLACGSIINPEKDYHLEFLAPRRLLAKDLRTFLEEMELKPKAVLRNGAEVVYFKESETIEDLLTMMSAIHSTLEIMDIKIYKDMRNRINRLTNCETANITKTVQAAAKQIEAIERLEQEGRLTALPDELYRLALIRKKHPDASISELCELTGENISRSGMNHRLRRILKIAGEK